MTNPTVTPAACPKWKTCSAPVCPLDPNYSRCSTLNGDSVCPWLREAVKAGGAGNIPADIAPAVLRALPILQETGGAALRGKLNRAAQCPSRMPPEGSAGYAAREVVAMPLATPAPHRSSPMRHTSIKAAP